MKKLLLTCLLAMGLGLYGSAAVITVTGTITTNTTWTKNNQYLLKGFVYVDTLITLTIEPGTVIMGAAIGAQNPNPATLIIKRGAKIMADGTLAEPIVFTSAQPEGGKAAGDWGGVVICGRGPLNFGKSSTDPNAGGVMLLEGGYGAYAGGGANPIMNDNSGILRYVRIEYAGYPVLPNQEINSLTMGGVGSGTTIEYVMVSYANDDAFEWFGGNVNCKYLIAYNTVDDMFDTDYGYSGKVQFALGISHPSIADVSGSNGFESDNDAGATTNQPHTTTIFSNVTILGPKSAYNSTGFNSNFKRAVHFKKNTRLSIFNSIIGGFPTGALIDGANTEANATANELEFENNFVFAADGANSTHPTNKTADTAANTSSVILNPVTWFTGGNNTEYDNASSLMLTNPYPASGQKNPMPMVGSPVLTGASFSNAKFNGDTYFDKTVTYRGAFGTTDWTAGWADWDPQDLAVTAIKKGAENILSAVVYPNPSADVSKVEVALKSASDVTIIVSDMMGRQIELREMNNTKSVSETINVAALAKGVYIVNIYINGMPAQAELLIVK